MSSSTIEKPVSIDEKDAPPAGGATRLWRGTKWLFWTLVDHLRRTGVGLVCAVGYFDP